MARAKVWDILLNSGDTASGVFMTEAGARKVIAQMYLDAAEYFPLTLVRYRSVADQTIIESEVFEIEQPSEPESEPQAELMQGEPTDVCMYLRCGATARYIGFGPAPIRCERHAIFGMATLAG